VEANMQNTQLEKKVSWKVVGIESHQYNIKHNSHHNITFYEWWFCIVYNDWD